MRVVQNPGDEITVSGYTSAELYLQYQNMINWEYLYGSEFAAWAYDSIWTGALALHNTIQNLIDMGKCS